MRRVVTGMAGGLALLGLFGTASAGSISGAACANIPNPFIVTSANVGQMNDGFNCPGVDLVINFSLSDNTITPKTGLPVSALVGPGPGVPTILKLTAKSITVATPGDPTDPAQRIQIVNDNGGSEVTLTAVGGDITVNGGTIMAHKNLRFICNQQNPACKFKADNSDLVAASNFDNPQAGGGLFFNIFGPINIHTTTVHGGDTLEMESVSAEIVLICTGGADTGCKDPNLNPIPQVVLDNCTNGTGNPPIIFPCTLPAFPDAAALKAVCFPVGAGVICNGGHKEKRFTAGTFIDFTGSTITADEHVTITCKGINFPAVPNSGDLKAHGATFDMDSLVINCKGKVDISDSKITMAAHLTINSGLNCPAGTTCIDASFATILAKPVRFNTGGGGRIIDVCGATFTLPGSGFPNLNGGLSPPYGATVLDTAAECAPRPATIFLN